MGLAHTDSVSRLRLGGIIVGAIAGCALLALVGVIFWENATAVSVEFVNDTHVAVDLPDCSTDLASLSPGQHATLPVASDHPNQCTVDNSYQGKVIGCITMPASLHVHTVVRLSQTHPCR